MTCPRAIQLVSGRAEIQTHGCRIHALNHTHPALLEKQSSPREKNSSCSYLCVPQPKGQALLVHLRGNWPTCHHRTSNSSQLLGPLSLTIGKSLEPRNIREISNTRSDKEPEKDHNKPNKMGKLEETEKSQETGEKKTLSNILREIKRLYLCYGGGGGADNKNSWKLKI